MQTYVYIVAATQKDGTRDHNAANAERVRFSLETMVQPAFLAAKQESSVRLAALEQAQVLVICADAKSDLKQEALVQALDAFRKKQDGRIYVFGKNKSVIREIEDAEFVREKNGSMDELLRAILLLEDEDMDEFELARKMQEQQQEEADAQPHTSNLGNILFICGFIAAVCLLFRFIIWMRG